MLLKSRISKLLPLEMRRSPCLYPPLPSGQLWSKLRSRRPGGHDEKAHLQNSLPRTQRPVTLAVWQTTHMWCLTNSCSSEVLLVTSKTCPAHRLSWAGNWGTISKVEETPVYAKKLTTETSIVIRNMCRNILTCRAPPTTLAICQEKWEEIKIISLQIFKMYNHDLPFLTTIKRLKHFKIIFSSVEIFYLNINPSIQFFFLVCVYICIILHISLVPLGNSLLILCS